MARVGEPQKYYVVEQEQAGLWNQIGKFAVKAAAERFREVVPGRTRVVYTYPSSYDYQVLDAERHHTNARGGAYDEQAATELKLYIDNTSELMGPRSQGESIRQNLLRKLKKGTFDLEKSVKLWAYLAEAGAKMYAKEFAEERDWHNIFSVATRNAVAREMAEEFHAQAQAGEFPEVGKLFGRLESNPSRRYSRFDDAEEIHPEVDGFRFYDDIERPYPGGVLKSSGMVVMVDEEGREVFLVNPLDVPRGRYDRTAPYILWFGAHAPTRLFIWSDSLEDALEEAGGVLAEHFPGLIHEHDDPILKELYDEAREELGPDAEDDQVHEQATADLTYTESGYITSYEWGIASDPEGNQWDAAIVAGTAISKWLYREEYGDED